MENNHLIRTVYVVFDELKGFKTPSGWSKKFNKARIFSQRHHILQTKKISEEFEKENPTIRAVPIRMMLDETDYMALKLGGFLE